MILAIDKKYCIGDLVQLMPRTDTFHFIVNTDEILLLKIEDKVLVNKYANHPSRNLFPYHEKEQYDKNHFTELFEYNRIYLNFRGSAKGFSVHHEYLFKGNERALYSNQPLLIDDDNMAIDSIELSRQEIEELFDSSHYDSIYVINRNGSISFARNDKDKICIGENFIPNDDEIKNFKFYDSFSFINYSDILLTVKYGKFYLKWFRIDFIEKDKFRLTTSPIAVVEPTVDDVLDYVEEEYFIDYTPEPGQQFKVFSEVHTEEKSLKKTLRRLFKKNS